MNISVYIKDVNVTMGVKNDESGTFLIALISFLKLEKAITNTHTHTHLYLLSSYRLLSSYLRLMNMFSFKFDLVLTLHIPYTETTSQPVKSAQLQFFITTGLAQK